MAGARGVAEDGVYVCVHILKARRCRLNLRASSAKPASRHACLAGTVRARSHERLLLSDIMRGKSKTKSQPSEPPLLLLLLPAGPQRASHAQPAAHAETKYSTHFESMSTAASPDFSHLAPFWACPVHTFLCCILTANPSFVATLAKTVVSLRRVSCRKASAVAIVMSLVSGFDHARMQIQSESGGLCSPILTGFNVPIESCSHCEYVGKSHQTPASAQYRRPALDHGNVETTAIATTSYTSETPNLRTPLKNQAFSASNQTMDLHPSTFTRPRPIDSHFVVVVGQCVVTESGLCLESSNFPDGYGDGSSKWFCKAYGKNGPFVVSFMETNVNHILTAGHDVHMWGNDGSVSRWPSVDLVDAVVPETSNGSVEITWSMEIYDQRRAGWKLCKASHSPKPTRTLGPPCCATRVHDLAPTQPESRMHIELQTSCP